MSRAKIYHIHLRISISYFMSNNLRLSVRNYSWKSKDNTAPSIQICTQNNFVVTYVVGQDLNKYVRIPIVLLYVEHDVLALNSSMTLAMRKLNMPKCIILRHFVGTIENLSTYLYLCILNHTRKSNLQITSVVSFFITVYFNWLSFYSNIRIIFRG